MPNHRYRLRDTTVIAVRWHGDHGKRDSFDEIQEAFGVSHARGQIHKFLNGVVSISDGTSGPRAKPGEWFVRGIKDEMITMTDDLFRAFFKEVE